MSGGYFEYVYARIEDFASRLALSLDETDPPWENPAVVERLRAIARSARQLAAMAREAEWLYSGDTSEESFLRRVRALESAANETNTHANPK